MLTISFTNRAFDKLDSDCSVVTVFSDQRPLLGQSSLLDWRVNGRLSRLIQSQRFEGDFEDVLLLPSEGRVKSNDILLIGLGPKTAFETSRISSLIEKLLKTLDQMKVKDFTICLSDLIEDPFEWRNSLRLLVSKLHDFPQIELCRLCEKETYVKEAKKRHMDFGLKVNVTYELFVA